MANVRLLAITGLHSIFSHEEKPGNLIDRHALQFNKRDTAFLMEITYGVIRYRDTLDWILNHFLKKPVQLSDFTMNNLRTAVYQIYFMRTPDWAVVHEAVNIEKGKGIDRKLTAGKPSLVNAILRNMLRERERFKPPFEFDNSALSIAVNTSHPLWLVKRWIKRFGDCEAGLIAESNNIIPPLTVRANTLRTTREKLMKMLADHRIASEPTQFSPSGILLKNRPAYSELSFAHDLFTVQDEASQLISYLLNPQPGERILDACAAPGGKTSHLAELSEDKGKITAVEKDRNRMTMLEQHIKKLGITSVRTLHADMIKLMNVGFFDKILLDAPCSSIGVIRRNPDIKYRHTARELMAFQAKQLQLLIVSSRLLKKKGVLVYSVCSTEPEEGEDVIKEFLKTERDFRIINDEQDVLAPLKDDMFFRSLPHIHNMDGFFGVSLCKQT
jgi:16S rRNA (cytosine967-C5)-methyltransferase